MLVLKRLIIVVKGALLSGRTMTTSFNRMGLGVLLASLSLVISNLFLGFATEFCQYAQGVLGVKKSNLQTFGTVTCFFVDKTDAFVGSILQGFVCVIHGKSDVLHTATTTVVGDKFGDRTLRVGSFE